MITERSLKDQVVFMITQFPFGVDVSTVKNHFLGSGYLARDIQLTIQRTIDSGEIVIGNNLCLFAKMFKKANNDKHQ